MQQPPRILIVTRNLPPLTGGMERLNWHIARELASFAEVRVVGPQGSAALAPPNVLIEEATAAGLAGFLSKCLIAGLRICLSWRPTLIFAGSGLTAPIAVLLAKLCGSRSAVYAHGLDLTVKHFIYQHVWLRFIARADVVVVNSLATRLLALHAGVREDRIQVVHPGVELPPARAEQLDSCAFRAKHGIGDEKILLSVGRLTRRKGILEFVSNVLPAIVERFPRCRLVVVGGVPTNALAASAQSISSIQEASSKVGVSANILFVGTVPDDELSELYGTANLHVFPVQHLSNDPEGFGMVAIEAAAHGLATVAFRTGGVPDAVSEGTSGRLIDPGDDAAFARAAIALMECPLPVERCRSFAQEFSWNRIGEKLAVALNLTSEQKLT